jgi:hypothetical protein
MEPMADRHPVHRGAALAVLDLLSEVAGERPLTRVIDDEHWIDHAAVRALGFGAGVRGTEVAAGPLELVLAARSAQRRARRTAEAPRSEGLQEDYVRGGHSGLAERVGAAVMGCARRREGGEA